MGSDYAGDVYTLGDIASAAGSTEAEVRADDEGARAIQGQDGEASPPQPTHPVPGFAIIVAAAILSAGAVAGLVILTTSSSHPPRSPLVEQKILAPLELIALEHDRDESRLVVRGIVRNPRSAPALHRLLVVVQATTGDGDVVASEQAPAAAPILAPGAEAPFVVTVADAEAVDRYRVSFKADDRVVPHVDERARTDAARRK